MCEPDKDGAIQYALTRLQKELSADLTYHSLQHTRDIVMPGVIRLADLSGVGEIDTDLLLVAAAFHDIGFVKQTQEHERIGSQIAARALPAFGFSPPQIEAIRNMIMATRLPQSPKNLLEEILADADLDVLGREEFMVQSQGLRKELAALGDPTSDEEWFQRQLEFLLSHSYFTQAARGLRNEGKRKNILDMEERLRQIQNHKPH